MRRRSTPIEGVSDSAFLGVLGMPGFTAYVGLLDVAELKPDDVVFVSGAAGAVGSLAGQIAKLRGNPRVIGSAGSPEKVAWLTGELGFDAAFDYHDGQVARLLQAAAPDGIDVYFDNVGGEHLEAAVFAFNQGGRAALCGAISGYNGTSLRRAQPVPRRRQAAHAARLHRQRPRRPSPRLPRRGRRVGARRQGRSSARRSSRVASRPHPRPSSTCCAAPTPARCS